MPRGRPRKDQTVKENNSLETENFHENSIDEGKDQMSEVTIEQEKSETVVPKKKGTRPEWKPSGQLPKLKAPAGFTAKWASSDPGKLSKLKAEGWEIMKPSDNKGQAIVSGDVNDSGSVTGELRYRDLVAVMLPNELKQARDEWVRSENREAMRSVLKDTDEKLKNGGVQTYHPRGQDGRIVID